MNRHAAYLGTLKFHFHGALVAGCTDRRAAYRHAKRLAAQATFAASTESLRVWVPVW